MNNSQYVLFLDLYDPMKPVRKKKGIWEQEWAGEVCPNFRSNKAMHSSIK